MTTQTTKEWRQGLEDRALEEESRVGLRDAVVRLGANDIYQLLTDADRCAELEEQVAAMKGVVEATGRVAYDCSRDRCADLEAQLQQSRDDYETALREHEKTTAQLRDAQHDANNAAMLREAAELARSERDRVEGENVKLHAGMEMVREFRDEARRDGLERWAATYVDDELSSALSIAGVERGNKENEG